VRLHLLELDGLDLRRCPIERREAALAKLLRGAPSAIVLNEIFEEDGAIVYREACKLRRMGQSAALSLVGRARAAK
jgi:ATP-dependent DNA ligase